MAALVMVAVIVHGNVIVTQAGKACDVELVNTSTLLADLKDSKLKLELTTQKILFCAPVFFLS